MLPLFREETAGVIFYRSESRTSPNHDDLPENRILGNLFHRKESLRKADEIAKNREHDSRAEQRKKAGHGRGRLYLLRRKYPCLPCFPSEGALKGVRLFPKYDPDDCE